MAKPTKSSTETLLDALDGAAADGDVLSMVPDLESALGLGGDDLATGVPFGDTGGDGGEESGGDGTTALFSPDGDADGPTLFDGADGIDTLRVILDSDEFSEFKKELAELRDWMDGLATGDDDASDGEVFTTSFGLTVKDITDLEIFVEGTGEVPLGEIDSFFGDDATATDAPVTVAAAGVHDDAPHPSTDAPVTVAAAGVLDVAPHPSTDAPVTVAAAGVHDDAPHPSKVASARDELIRGAGGDDPLPGGGGIDDICGFKGDDTLTGLEGDDWLRGGHGDDELDGGAGSDMVNGGKGDDTLTYTMAENGGATDLYDGGKGVDTLTLNLTPEEYDHVHDELVQLEEWISTTANPKRSEGAGFNDASSHSAKHSTFETSFGLEVRNFEDLKVYVDGTAVDLDDSLPEVGDTVAVDLEETPPAGDSTVETVESTDGPLSVESATVSLAKGSTATVSVDVEVRDLPPIYDVFLLQDLSGSFWNDLPNVQAQFSGLYDNLTADSDVQFGVGSFIDKPGAFSAAPGPATMSTRPSWRLRPTRQRSSRPSMG